MLLFTHAPAWAAARELAAAGRRAEALAKLATVLRFPGLPDDVAAAANRLAGELHLKVGRFAKARRHLLAAAELQPQNAELHHLIGVAFQDDPHGSDARAARRFKFAADLAPENATFRAALGLALVRLNRVGAGLKHTDAAVTLAPSDHAVLSVVVQAFREADRPERGLKVISQAMFLAPHDAGIRQLWNRVRFDVTQAEQARSPKAKWLGRPKFLPFLRVETPAIGTPAPGGIVRRDLGVRPTPHLNRLRSYGDRA
jgi:Flp pilus assembly protein TadD